MPPIHPLQDGQGQAVGQSRKPSICLEPMQLRVDSPAGRSPLCRLFDTEPESRQNCKNERAVIGAGEPTQAVASGRLAAASHTLRNTKRSHERKTIPTGASLGRKPWTKRVYAPLRRADYQSAAGYQPAPQVLPNQHQVGVSGKCKCCTHVLRGCPVRHNGPCCRPRAYRPLRWPGFSGSRGPTSSDRREIAGETACATEPVLCLQGGQTVSSWRPSRGEVSWK